MIGPFLTSLRFPKVFEEKGSQGPKIENFEKIQSFFNSLGDPNL